MICFSCKENTKINRDILHIINKDEEDMIGENGLKRILSDFFSPKNQDVESFLKKAFY